MSSEEVIVTLIGPLSHAYVTRHYIDRQLKQKFPRQKVVIQNDTSRIEPDGPFEFSVSHLSTRITFVSDGWCIIRGDEMVPLPPIQHKVYGNLFPKIHLQLDQEFQITSLELYIVDGSFGSTKYFSVVEQLSQWLLQIQTIKARQPQAEVLLVVNQKELQKLGLSQIMALNDLADHIVVTEPDTTEDPFESAILSTVPHEKLAKDKIRIHCIQAGYCYSQRLQAIPTIPALPLPSNEVWVTSSFKYLTMGYHLFLKDNSDEEEQREIPFLQGEYFDLETGAYSQW